MNSFSKHSSGRSNILLVSLVSVILLIGACSGVLIARQSSGDNFSSASTDFITTESVISFSEEESVTEIEGGTDTTAQSEEAFSADSSATADNSITSVTGKTDITTSTQVTTKADSVSQATSAAKADSTTVKPTEATSAQRVTAPPATEAKQVSGGSFANRFYYPRLTQGQQEIYRAAYAAASSGENSFTFTSPSSDYSELLKTGLYAFVYDYPEYVSIRTGYNSVRKGSNVTVTFKTWGFAGSTPSSFNDAVDRKASSIASQAKGYSSDFDRIKFVHDYLCKNNVYDYTAMSQPEVSYSNQQAHTAYGALINGRSVCEGYAKAFVIIMHKLGYECGYISGKGNGGNHSWNIIKVNGQYYYMDVTWDDQTDNSSPENIKYDYFCVTSEEISSDHTAGSSYSYPAATSHDLNYYYRNGYVMDTYDYDKASEILRKQEGNPYYCLKFTSRSAYSAAYSDIKNLAAVARSISGSSSSRYYYDEDTYTLRFVNPNY